MKKLLAFALTLVITAVAFTATHCPDDPDCGHPGGTCESDGACVAPLPGLGDAPICGGRGGGGGGGGPQLTPTPGSEYANLSGQYSFGGTCQPDEKIDPVTVVLVEGHILDVEEHADHHGLDHRDDRYQLFLDEGVCVQGQIDQASNDGQQFCQLVLCPESRWHFRGNEQLAPVAGSIWFTLTPHYDQAISQSCWHSITNPYTFEAPDFPPGPWSPNLTGFDAGRIWVTYQFTTLESHLWIDTEFWGNIDTMKKCGDYLTGSDGYVDIVRLVP